MEALEAILSRRSIRKFTKEVISDELLHTILKAGFAAPSAHNTQPWEFVIVRDPNLLNEISENHKYTKMLPDAGCGIVVCGDVNRQKTSGFLVEDCSAAIENMVLAIHALNLGGVWCGIYPHENYISLFQKILKLPENIIPIGIIAVGHKTESKPPRENYDENKIHYDNW